MTHAPAYDPLETIHWMLEQARTELAAETYLTDEGRVRRKSKARRNDDRVRFATLCAVLWNVSGRPEPLDALVERQLTAA